MVKKLLSILLIFGFYSQADMHDMTDSESSVSDSKSGFFAIYPSIAMYWFGIITGHKFNMAYGGVFSKNKYFGSFEVGVTIGSSSHLNGLQLKYEYDFLNKSDQWSAGLDISALFRAYYSDYLDAIGTVNTLGMFVEKPISKSISTLIRAGALLFKTFSLQQFNDTNSYYIGTYFGFGVRYYLRN